MTSEPVPAAVPEVDGSVAEVAKAPAAAPPPREPLGSRRGLERGALCVIAGVLLCGFLHFAQPLLVPIASAWLLAAALKPAVRFLQRLHIAPPFGAALVLLVVGTLATLAAVRIGGDLDRWISDAPGHLADVRSRLRPLLEPLERWTRASVEVSAIASVDAARAAPAAAAEPGAVLVWTKQLVVGLVSTVALLYFLLAAGDRFRQKLIHVMPTLSRKKRALEIAREIEERVTVFLFTVSCVNALLGVCVWLALEALGMPGAELWGVLAAVVNYVPYFGPVVGVGALLLAGVAEFSSFGEAVLPAAIYLGLHVIESNLVTPQVLGRRMRLNPVVVFVDLLFWTWLWGVPGALLAVPILLCVRIVAERIDPLSPVVEFLDR